MHGIYMEAAVAGIAECRPLRSVPYIRLTYIDTPSILFLMIRTWADREAEKIFSNEVSRRLGAQVSKVARRKLKMLNAATNVTDLRVPPGNRLEALKGDRKGQHSIRVNDQYRVCFRWRNGDAFDVEIVDYH
jgi:proteic killer suppression protein